MEIIMYIVLTVTAITMTWMNYEYWKLSRHFRETVSELLRYRAKEKEQKKNQTKNMLKLTTINQIVESILAQAQSDIKLPHEDVREATFKRMANEATIILKTAMICDNRGIDEAMKYYNGTHSEDEYQEYRTSVILPD